MNKVLILYFYKLQNDYHYSTSYHLHLVTYLPCLFEGEKKNDLSYVMGM